jgi:ATP-binding cassette subfamily B protein
LGKLEPGSADLSEGQWQRLALARAFGRQARFLVLDEPAAALDALAESRVYRVIRDIGATRCTTTLYVTHRLAAARSADEIIVMKDGRIIEQGTHAALPAGDSYYAQMFNTQRKWYLRRQVAEA